MKITVIEFTAKQLRSIHNDHLGFLLASSHCCNELIAVMPYMMFEHNVSAANIAEKAFIELRFYTLIRLQIGKIFEYRDLCNKYIGKIRKTFPAMAEKLSNQAGEISRAIGSAKWAERVRNKVAFHFDENYAFETLNDMEDAEKLRFLFGDFQGVTAFNFADHLINETMFLEAGKGDKNSGQDIVKDWTLSLRKKILSFHAVIAKDIFKQYGLTECSTELEIRDQYSASRGSVFIPLIGKVSE